MIFRIKNQIRKLKEKLYSVIEESSDYEKIIKKLNKHARRKLYIERMGQNKKAILQSMVGKKVCLRYVELILTTVCTLNCKDCSDLINYYQKPNHIDIDKNIESLKGLMNSIDSLNHLGLLGGEVLCYPYLYEILAFCDNEEKIKKVTIVTNGTLVIKDKRILDILKNEKFNVYISNYGTFSNHKYDLENQLKENNIKYILKEENMSWKDYGNIEIRHRNKNELKKQYYNCNNMYCSILNGKLYQCPRSSNLSNLGIISEGKNNYIDLLEKNKELKKKIYKFTYGYIPYLEACNYCNRGTKNFGEISAGIQADAQNNNELISVIICVYNCEKYIKNCIDSVINQTYKNLEIVIVNDGSTDNTLNIIESYNDSRLKIITQENKGISNARNVGLNHSTGQYIYFVDADDSILNDTIEYLYDLCKKYDVSISTCRPLKINKLDYEIKDSTELVEVIDSKELLKKVLLATDCQATVWNKLIKKEIWDNIRFENRLTDDVPVSYKLALATNRIAYSNKIKYIYLKRKGSLTRSDNYELIIDIFKASLDKYRDINKVYPDLIENRMCLLNVIMKQYMENDDKIKNLLQEYNALKMFKEIFSIKIIFSNYNFRGKIKILLFRISPKLYKNSIIFYLRIKRMVKKDSMTIFQ